MMEKMKNLENLQILELRKKTYNRKYIFFAMYERHTLFIQWLGINRDYDETTITANKCFNVIRLPLQILNSFYIPVDF